MNVVGAGIAIFRKFSFNRYMVECESRSSVSYDACHKGTDPGFNRYMVECEFSVRTFLFVPASVLIDTWWNVNEREQKSILEDYGF